MIISVDHGNKSIKTPRLLFTSGLIESDTRPGIKTDCIFWNGKYYTLTEKRISYLRDKTVNVLLRQEMVAGPHRKVPHSDQLADEAGTPFPAPFFYSDLFHIPKFALR